MKLTKILNEEYGNVTESELQTEKIAKNVTVEEILQKYLIWRNAINPSAGFSEFQKMYEHSLEIVSNISYSSEDVPHFCFALKDLKKDSIKKVPNIRLGFFISALINNHYEKTKTSEKYRIITAFFSGHKNHLGYHTNGAEIEIIGDVDNFCGQYMQSGSIFIDGNSGVQLGEKASGGTIHLKGNASIHAAHTLNGGRIIIEGNAGQDLAAYMTSGFISVGGKIERIGKWISGGEIYNQGTRVYP